ncbi:MAG: hypothetical protein ACJ716_11945 [Marmoricola sp.]
MNMHRSATTTGSRRRRTFTTALSAFAVLGLVTAGVAVADTLNADGDQGKVSQALAYKKHETTQGRACESRGTPVNGFLTVSFAGSSHLTPGDYVTVNYNLSDVPTGVTISPSTTTKVPANYSAAHPDFTVPFTTTVLLSAPDTIGTGNTQIPFTVSDSSGHTASSANGKFKVFIHCSTDTPDDPENIVPVVTVTAPSSIPEGSPATITFSVADADGTSWTFDAGSPACGNGGTLVPGSASITGVNGTFQCVYADGLVPAVASTVSVAVVDETSATSDTATADILVTNVTPVVAVPTFAVSSVDCQTTATLNNISFTDPGADATWNGTINWGDGSALQSFTAAAAGAVPAKTHVYAAPGTYAATVAVTDKDLATGSNTTAAGSGITVLQTYSTSFLQPFDASTPSKLIPNTMKNGRTVPVKVTLTDTCTGLAVTDPTKVVTIGVTEATPPNGATTVPDAVETYSDAGASSAGTNVFRYNNPFWIYNLDSTGLKLVTGKTYRINVYVGSVKATITNWALLQPVK